MDCWSKIGYASSIHLPDQQPKPLCPSVVLGTSGTVADFALATDEQCVFQSVMRFIALLRLELAGDPGHLPGFSVLQRNPTSSGENGGVFVFACWESCRYVSTGRNVIIAQAGHSMLRSVQPWKTACITERHPMKYVHLFAIRNLGNHSSEPQAS